jgi:hypothetical protein
MSSQMYTHEQLEIALLKQKDEHLSKTLDRIESELRWILGLMGTGFLGLLGIMAHGFHWII